MNRTFTVNSTVFLDTFHNNFVKPLSVCFPASHGKLWHPQNRLYFDSGQTARLMCFMHLVKNHLTFYVTEYTGNARKSTTSALSTLKMWRWTEQSTSFTITALRWTNTLRSIAASRNRGIVPAYCRQQIRDRSSSVCGLWSFLCRPRRSFRASSPSLTWKYPQSIQSFVFTLSTLGVTYHYASWLLFSFNCVFLFHNDLFRAFRCTGIGKIPHLAAVLSGKVNNDVVTAS